MRTQAKLCFTCNSVHDIPRHFKITLLLSPKLHQQRPGIGLPFPLPCCHMGDCLNASTVCIIIHVHVVQCHVIKINVQEPLDCHTSPPALQEQDHAYSLDTPNKIRDNTFCRYVVLHTAYRPDYDPSPLRNLEHTTIDSTCTCLCLSKQPIKPSLASFGPYLCPIQLHVHMPQSSTYMYMYMCVHVPLGRTQFTHLQEVH